MEEKEFFPVQTWTLISNAVLTGVYVRSKWGVKFLSGCRGSVLAARRVTGSSHGLTKVPTHFRHGQGSGPMHGEHIASMGEGANGSVQLSLCVCACTTKLHWDRTGALFLAGALRSVLLCVKIWVVVLLSFPCRCLGRSGSV